MIYHNAGEAGECDSYSLADLDAECRKTVAGLRKHLGEFDVIAVTGLSGILPGVAAALKLKLPLAILRKPNDDTHQLSGERYSGDGSRWVNGLAITWTPGCRVLWLDDFSSTGVTRRRIIAAVEELGGKVVASYYTRDHQFEVEN